MSAEVVLQLFLATILGTMIGAERESKKKQAGLQTFSLVTLSSCLFTVVASALVGIFVDQTQSFDPTRIIQAIAVGIGFVGAGIIFHQPDKTTGLTTAAALLASAAIGVSVGARLYLLAIFSIFLILFVLVVFRFLEERIF